VDIALAYRNAWSYRPPKTFRAMWAAGLLEPFSTKPFGAWGDVARKWLATGEPRRLILFPYEIYDATTIAEGDAFVRERLVPGLVPIAGDGSGDRWCFDTRLRIGGTTPVMHVPHDGGGGVYVAPSFAAFVYRTIIEQMHYQHMFEAWDFSRDDVLRLVERDLDLAKPWLLRRWQRTPKKWPSYRELEEFFARDPAFARLPGGELDVFT
jgi:hypothetical protein